MQPLVSVIICVYNAGEYLRPAVASALAQTYPNLDIILIDDGSTDDGLASLGGLRDRRLRVFRQPNAGKPAALNRALELAEGEYYLLQDADDLSHPRRVERLLACLEAQPELGAVFSGHELLMNDRPIAPRFKAKDEAACRRDIEHFTMPAHDPTAMYRMAAARRFAYAADLPVVEGFDFIMQIGEQYPLRVLGECLYSYRIHPHQVTRRAPAERDRLIREAVRRACLRRGLDPAGVLQDRCHYPAAETNGMKENYIFSHFIESVLDLRGAGRHAEALRTGLHCSRLHPADPLYHKALIYALLPQPLIPFLRHTAQAKPQPPPRSGLDAARRL